MPETMNMATMTWDPSEVDAATHTARMHTDVVHLRERVTTLEATLAALTTKQSADKDELLVHFGRTRDELLGAFHVAAAEVKADVERLLAELERIETPDAPASLDGLDELMFAVLFIAKKSGITERELREGAERLRRAAGPIAAPVPLAQDTTQPKE